MKLLKRSVMVALVVVVVVVLDQAVLAWLDMPALAPPERYLISQY